MLQENDRFYIPEKYLKMSVSELEREKERVYREIRKNSANTRKTEARKEIIKFYL